jgi:hypothetical protein
MPLPAQTQLHAETPEESGFGFLARHEYVRAPPSQQIHAADVSSFKFFGVF